MPTASYFTLLTRSASNAKPQGAPWAVTPACDEAAALQKPPPGPINSPESEVRRLARLVERSETLKRYLVEFEFRYNNRSGLGITDGERTMRALR